MIVGAAEIVHEDVTEPVVSPEAQGVLRIRPNLAKLAFSQTFDDGSRARFWTQPGVVLDILEIFGPIEMVAVGGEEKFERIKRAVCDVTGLSLEDIEGHVRRRPYVEARQAAMYLAREHTDLSYPAIAQQLGGRDHTTVIHGERKAATVDASHNISAILRRVELSELMDDVMLPRDTNGVIETRLVTVTPEGVWEYPTEVIRPAHAALLGVDEGSLVHQVDGRERPQPFDFYHEQTRQLFDSLGSAATTFIGEDGSNVFPVAFSGQGRLPFDHV